MIRYTFIEAQLKQTPNIKTRHYLTSNTFRKTSKILIENISIHRIDILPYIKTVKNIL